MNIRLTFDYELFLNEKTGDVDHCLIIPTNHILKMLEKHQVKATFFIDMAYLLRLQDLKEEHKSLQDDYEKVTRQIKDIANKGHEVALHIHPQWFYSSYDGKEWEMDFQHYKLSDMPVELANSKFFSAYCLLKEIVGGDIYSFRAGGFSIQDYNGFYEMLSKTGIKNDSSVLMGEKQMTDLQSYDYSSITEPNAYCFEDNIVDTASNGTFEEYPISTLHLSFLRYATLKLKWMLSRSNQYVRWGNGGDSSVRRNKEFASNVLRRFVDGVQLYVSADDRLVLLLKDVLDSFAYYDYHDMTVLGHPKLASIGSIDNLEEFIIYAQKNNHFFVLIKQ